MSERFDAFILFAEMRTGSNHLEQLINSAPEVSCLGEVFNPTFIGHPNEEVLAGFDLATREKDPIGCLNALKEATPGLMGFRFFHDHDPRVLDRVIPDPRVAKIILRRNPLDSYISRKIASETGQWKLTDVKHRRSAKIHFVAAEFQAMLEAWQVFYGRLRGQLQRTGQAAFQLDYADLDDPAAVNGILRFLGVNADIDPSMSKLKPQNPAPALSKVDNPEEMLAAVAAIDSFGLDQVLHRDVKASARVPQFLATPGGELLFMPLPGGAGSELRAFLAQSAGVEVDDLVGGFDQRTLRAWYKEHPQHRRFTFVRHPLARAHSVFCSDVLPTGRPRFAQMRRVLRRRYGVPLPRAEDWPSYDLAAHGAAFSAWLAFLKGCLAGQTALEAHRSWSLQADAVQALAGVAGPDFVLREGGASFGLDDLARLARLPNPAKLTPATLSLSNDAPFSLTEVYSPKLEELARKAYRRDYLVFGFDDWTG
ncbi:MAG: nodulation protein NodH [Pseudomonadota bacterium]